MKNLSELTPAEVYILINEKITHRELLKITFIDLLFKQVLRSFEVERQPHIRQEVRIYQYIGIGQNFNNYKSKNHEKFFLSTFEKDAEIEILFRSLVKVGFQKSMTLSNFKDELIQTPILKKCFSQNIFQIIFNSYSFTDYGKELKRKVEKEIENLNAEFSNLDNIENQKAIELIKVIGANIFLLDNMNYELLSKIEADLATEMNRTTTSTDGSGCSGWYFDNYSSDFDSGCSSHSSFSDASGCSGCSGCAGCGGCGS
uniref:hypothetical protein n=1 Tax=Flavobacterium sp. TaxID=239 RepID=UPI00404AB868